MKAMKIEFELLEESDVERIVGRVVGELLNDMMQMISERFDRIEASITHHALS